jgi:regulator of sigma E protease
VEAFSIGFGKPIFKMVRKGIEYKIGWLPLGGYVKMKGESLEEGAEEAEDSFQFTRWWKKVIIAFSGPLSNLLFALLIFILTFMIPSRMEDQSPVVGKVTGDYELIFEPGDSIITVNGTPVQGWYQFLSNLSLEQANNIQLFRAGNKMSLTIPKIDLSVFANEVLPLVPATVGEINPGMPAWRAGMKQGDKIVSVNSISVTDWYDMREMIISSSSDSVHLTIQRGDSLFQKVLELESNPLSDDQKLIGVIQTMPVSYKQSYPPLKAIENGVKSTFGFIIINYVGLYRVISRPETIKSSVGGPVMIYSLSSQSARKGWNSWLVFIAAISLVLMIMNLLPIPVLDGGHIIFALVHGIIGKPIPVRIQIVLQNIGLVLLMLLMVYAFYNDFTKFFERVVSNMHNP